MKTGSIGSLTLVGIAFIVLKLTGHIDWSWVWVLAPLWALYGLIAIITVLAVIAGVLSASVKRTPRPEKDFNERLLSLLDKKGLKK